jgi:hypothetical protein
MKCLVTIMWEIMREEEEMAVASMTNRGMEGGIFS